MQQELSSGCAGASQGIILCHKKNQLERDDLKRGSRIRRHRRWMTESGGRIDRDGEGHLTKNGKTGCRADQLCPHPVM